MTVESKGDTSLKEDTNKSVTVGNESPKTDRNESNGDYSLNENTNNKTVQLEKNCYK